MNIKSLYQALNKPQTAATARKKVDSFLKSNDDFILAPFGGRESNKGPITITSCSGRALIERCVNSFDSFSEMFVNNNPSAAAATSVKDLVNNHMGFDISTATDHERVNFAATIGSFQRHKLYHGKVAKLGQSVPRSLNDREECVSIIDVAEGMTPKEMIDTGILSLHKSNKVGKPYLQGRYGQGGASSLSHCKLTFIASRKQGTDEIGFTAIYKIPAGGQYKESLWVMIVNKNTGLPITIDAKTAGRLAIECGTKITHYDYDMTQINDNTSRYGSPYHLFRRLLPNCEFPFYFDDKAPSKSKGSNRTLYGSCKALDRKLLPTAQKKEQKKILFRTYGDKDGFMYSKIGNGEIGVRAYVLDNKKDNKSPVPSFFESGKSAFITVNGQNQHEFDGRNMMVNNFPLLKDNLIIELSIDGLTLDQRDELDVSTRERVKESRLLGEIVEEAKRLLESVPELHTLEDEFRSKATTNTASNKSGLELLKNLGLFGVAGKGGRGRVVTGKLSTSGFPRVRRNSGETGFKRTWALSKVPSFIEFRHTGTLTVYINDKKQYAFLSTDAEDIFDSAISVSVESSSNLVVVKDSKLNNGNCRIAIDSTACDLGELGEITAMLKLADGTTLTARCNYRIAEQPVRTARGRPNKKGTAKIMVPAMSDPHVKFEPVSSGHPGETILINGREGDLMTLGGRATYDKESHTITIWYSTEYVHHRVCYKAAGGYKTAKKFKNIIETNMSALAITELVDQYTNKVEDVEINVNWNNALTMACLSAAQQLKK